MTASTFQLSREGQMTLFALPAGAQESDLVVFKELGQRKRRLDNIREVCLL